MVSSSNLVQNKIASGKPEEAIRICDELLAKNLTPLDRVKTLTSKADAILTQAWSAPRYGNKQSSGPIRAGIGLGNVGVLYPYVLMLETYSDADQTTKTFRRLAAEQFVAALHVIGEFDLQGIRYPSPGGKLMDDETGRRYYARRNIAQGEMELLLQKNMLVTKLAGLYLVEQKNNAELESLLQGQVPAVMKKEILEKVAQPSEDMKRFVGMGR